ncbi:MAG: GNAT superfamily N-acetyltransferase, partial [Polaribacter sp.]
MEIQIKRTNFDNVDFINLVKELDAYLKITDRDEHDFYNQFNHIDVLKNIVVIYFNEIAVGCGAIKKFDNNTVEVKRMFVCEEKRGSGVAQEMLQELETWAQELGYQECVLETGIRQVEAVRFYKKCNYKIIPNYG